MANKKLVYAVVLTVSFACVLPMQGGFASRVFAPLQKCARSVLGVASNVFARSRCGAGVVLKAMWQHKLRTALCGLACSSVAILCVAEVVGFSQYLKDRLEQGEGQLDPVLCGAGSFIQFMPSCVIARKMLIWGIRLNCKPLMWLALRHPCRRFLLSGCMGLGWEVAPALILAAMSGHVKAGEYLIRQGAVVNQLHPHARTWCKDALGEAMRTGHNDFAIMLLGHGAIANQEGFRNYDFPVWGSSAELLSRLRRESGVKAELN